MSIDTTKIIHDTVIFVRDFLRNNLTDPKSATRPADAKFVLTNYPSRKVYYPHVIVYQLSGTGERLGGNSFIFKYPIRIAIDVLSLSVKECDDISDEILHKIRSNLDQFINFGLHSGFFPVFRYNPMPDKENVHRKSLELEFTVFVG